MISREIRLIARRIAAEMVKVSALGAHRHGLAYFIGLGVALGIVWEIALGRKQGEVTKMKPKEILEWAKNLPDVDDKKIIISD